MSSLAAWNLIVYHFFNLKRRDSEILTDFIWSLVLLRGLWTEQRKGKEDKRLLFLNSLTLFYVHQSSILMNIVLTRQEGKKGKVGVHERYFSLKSTRQMFFSNKTRRKVLSCYAK